MPIIENLKRKLNPNINMNQRSTDKELSQSDKDNELLRSYGIVGKNDVAEFVKPRNIVRKTITNIIEKVGVTNKQKWNEYLKDVDKMI